MGRDFASCGQAQILFPQLKSLLKSHGQGCLLIAGLGFLRCTSAINPRSTRILRNPGPCSWQAFFPFSFNSPPGVIAKRSGSAGCFPAAPIFLLKMDKQDRCRENSISDSRNVQTILQASGGPEDIHPHKKSRRRQENRSEINLFEATLHNFYLTCLHRVLYST